MSDGSIPLIRLRSAAGLKFLLGDAWRTVCAMRQARQTRRQLAEMDDRMLADLGISRGDARMEASRPMWDLEPRRR